ncbi:hypothetical protein PR048_026326 [Dryococelus australis]|uniref:HAT C-terminal dimerisation domain-containing protein n=1 Tax=Dryococelus australis TaxID=614101 RepID=A0ABQ9GL33_9NEOP|nr:hypothetical protein PR048_026326 [Dryococelus australis]
MSLLKALKCCFPLHHSFKYVCTVIVDPRFIAVLLSEHTSNMKVNLNPNHCHLVRFRLVLRNKNKRKNTHTQNHQLYPGKVDPFIWQNNKINFPLLAPIAQHYLGIPATQVSSERLFSSAGNTVSIRRENLLAEHVEELVFLHGRLSKRIHLVAVELLSVVAVELLSVVAVELLSVVAVELLSVVAVELLSSFSVLLSYMEPLASLGPTLILSIDLLLFKSVASGRFVVLLWVIDWSPEFQMSVKIVDASCSGCAMSATIIPV